MTASEERHIICYDGKRVALGPMQRHYIPLLMPWVNDPEVTRGLRISQPATLEAEYKWYDGLAENRGNDVFAILLKTSDGERRYIGHTGLHNMDMFNGIATTGTLIGDKTVHAQGIGTEAKLLLLHHAFHVLGFHKVLSDVKAFNGNSFGHLLKCGYQVVGVRKRHFKVGASRVDQITFEVFPEDFEPIWKRYQETRELPKLTDKQRELMAELMPAS